MIYLEPREIFDSFIVGTATGFNLEEDCLIYSKMKIINYLISDITPEGSADKDINTSKNFELALEYFEYNVLGAYFGPSTPVFLEDFSADLKGKYVQ